ncbi:MAG: asparaginase [Rhizobiales bacterium]|nr:asparaginase [Hyphomicrobiales bacterium]
MDNPVLVEVTRGEAVESAHRGAIAIVDADGHALVSIGDTARPVFPRSATKPLQALYLAESGALDHYGLGTRELALACASHNGEPFQVDGVVKMLSCAGLTPVCLECGSQWPKRADDRAAMVLADELPGAVHNNCSGKHAGFVCAARHLGEKVEGYVHPDHPVQRELKATLESLCDFRIDHPGLAGTDGCSIPTYAVPLQNMAHGFARFAAATSMGRARDNAARAIFDACTSHPEMVAGTGRFDTEMMQAFGNRVLLKTGAEGVYAGMIPSLGLGVALKCEDGGTRASETMMAAVLAALFEDGSTLLAGRLKPPLKNRNGWTVGTVRPVDGLVGRLSACRTGHSGHAVA